MMVHDALLFVVCALVVGAVAGFAMGFNIGIDHADKRQKENA